MLGVIGQATGRFGRGMQRALRVLLFLFVLAVAGLGGLAWRLDQGPLVLPWLAGELAAAANAHLAPMRLEVGEAALVWEGFSRGVDRPLDIRARDIVVHDAEGRRLVQVPQADVSLSLRALLVGRIAPRALAVEGARARVVRRADGSLAIDLAAAETAAGVEPGGVEPGGGARPAAFGWLFEALAQPLGTDLGGRATLLSQLRRVQLRDTVVVVRDEVLGIDWQVPALELDVRRREGGGAEGEASVKMAVADRVLSARGRVVLPPAGQTAGEAARVAVEVVLDDVVPAEFAGLAPGFAALAAVAAPVGLTATAVLGPDLVPHQGRLLVRMAGGGLLVARGRIPVLGAEAEIEGTREEMRLTLRRLALPREGGETVVSGTARLRPVAGMLEGELDLRLDEVGFADLAALWPDGVAGPGAKPWITGNITAGVARDLQVQMRMVATPDLSDGELTHLSGSLEGRDMVVHWLRPVPPVEGVAARLTFNSTNEIDIAILGGTQGGIAVPSGRVTLTGLAQRDQYLTVAIDLAGPVADAIAVLNHPRINILSRRPVTMRNPAGTVEGRLSVLALPLEDDVSLDDVRISASGKIAGLQLGGIAAGHDLTGGTLTFEVTNDALRAQGTATLAGVAAQLGVEMDFTDGVAAQVIQKISVAGTVEAGRLAALGLDTPELALDGSTAVKLEMVSRRSGRAEITVRADLARLGMRAERLNWGKPAGQAATAEALVVLAGERFAGIERLRIAGEGLSVQAALDWPARGTKRLRLARALLGASDVQGEIGWPAAAGQPWTVRLSGPSLDISGEMARKESPGDEPAVRGPAWNAELQVERLVLGPGRVLTGVRARSDNDGLVTRNARVTGRAGAGGFELSILPSGLAARRSLTITAQDAGALLLALDVMGDMRGGKMSLTGTYDDSRADHLLSGTAEVADFGMRNAPALGKLLQAITVIGAVEALSGPDLNFTRMVAPFRYTADAIDLADARAFSASLGMTAKGRVDLRRRLFDLQGTVVPAYFLNSLLGRVPLLGKLVSPEAGGGLFAMSYAVRGPFDDPSVSVNPLSGLTPGFLRGLFGVFEGTPAGTPGGTPGGGARGGGGDAAPPALPPPSSMPGGGGQ